MNEDNSNCLILDTGSYTFKGGLSNDEYPKYITSTIYGNDENGQNIFGSSLFKNNNQQEFRSLLVEGRVQDWNKMEQFWQQAIVKELNLDFQDRAVLTNHYLNTNKYEKEKKIQIFFEKFNVPYFYSVLNQLMGLYSSGRVNGVVVDSGHGNTTIVPVYEGASINFAQMNSQLAGRKITQYLQENLNINYKLASQLKEKHLKIDLRNGEVEDKSEQKIKLPDGRTIDLEIFKQLGEANFRPEIMNWQGIGLHYLINETINKVEYDQRKELINNVILCGGNSKTQNFSEKLQREFSKFLAQNSKIKFYNHNERQNAIWQGGAILSSLGSFQPMWITRNEYDECGPSIINRKNL